MNHFSSNVITHNEILSGEEISKLSLGTFIKVSQKENP